MEHSLYVRYDTPNDKTGTAGPPPKGAHSLHDVFLNELNHIDNMAPLSESPYSGTRWRNSLRLLSFLLLPRDHRVLVDAHAFLQRDILDNTADSAHALNFHICKKGFSYYCPPNPGARCGWVVPGLHQKPCCRSFLNLFSLRFNSRLPSIGSKKVNA